jgi:hypothetical protein
MSRLGLAALVVMLGCAHSKSSGEPGATLVAWADAVERDDSHGAWLLLSADTRASLGESTFRERWQKSRDEQRSQAAALREALAEHHVHERARVSRSDGWEASLVRDIDGWRVAAPRPREPAAPTPEEAVRRFARALEDHNFDAMLGLLSDPLRALVERELADRLGGLKQALERPIGIEGDRARIHYNTRFHLDVERDASGWRIADFN